MWHVSTTYRSHAKVVEVKLVWELTDGIVRYIADDDFGARVRVDGKLLYSTGIVLQRGYILVHELVRFGLRSSGSVSTVVGLVSTDAVVNSGHDKFSSQDKNKIACALDSHICSSCRDISPSLFKGCCPKCSAIVLCWCQ
jgi:hypothetical protein